MVRKKIGIYKVSMVPCVIQFQEGGTVLLYEGMNAFDWATNVLESLQPREPEDPAPRETQKSLKKRGERGDTKRGDTKRGVQKRVRIDEEQNKTRELSSDSDSELESRPPDNTFDSIEPIDIEEVHSDKRGDNLPIKKSSLMEQALAMAKDRDALDQKLKPVGRN